MLHFLNDLPNISACLIEVNHHKDIECIGKLEESIGKLAVEHFEMAGEVRVGGMEMYYDVSQIGDITSQKYDFYIYDFGTVEELTDSELASFMNKDLKFIILGSKVWEYKYMYQCFQKAKISDTQDNLYCIFNFTKPEEQKSIKEQMGNLNVYFNEFQPDPFEKKNVSYLENILQRYINDYNFEEIEKKKKFNLFRRK